jgi:pimeloyl-ACP methyl ester carboxylesterase
MKLFRGWALAGLAAVAWAQPCRKAEMACVEPVDAGSGMHVLVYRSVPLEAAAHPEITRAYIMVHGTNRNAGDYFLWALASTAAAGELDGTAVAAPWFKARFREGKGDAVEDGELYWTNEAWKVGEAALNGPPELPITSFDAMDRLLEDFNDAARFPNLREIVLAGHSAGGQYVQRYAAVNLVEEKLRVKVRYVVGNPSSYVYLDGERPRQGTVCSEKGGCTAPFTLYWDRENCTTYNRWRYGLEQLTGSAARAGAERILAQYPQRRVIYLVGELDTNSTDPYLDKTCGAESQGANRRERGVDYWNHMQAKYGATHKLDIATGCGHSAVCVFVGPAGVKAVFGPLE